MTYRILDLFCGAGGASQGYADAGFEVVGVDIEPQPRYPFRFYQADAMRFWTDWGYYFDAIHASPPCQRYSMMSRCRPGLAEKYPKLIEPVRELLEQTGLPYVIENVEGAPLRNPAQLCGSNFGLMAQWDDRFFELQRHRWFETNWGLRARECVHLRPSLPVYGHGAPGNRPDLRGAPVARMTREAMGIDWMTRDEMNEAIPPCFTAYIGRQIIAYLNSTSNREAA